MCYYYIPEDKSYISPCAERTPVDWKYVHYYIPTHQKRISPFAERAPVEWKYVPLLHTNTSKMHIAIRWANTRWMEICSVLYIIKIKNACRHSRSEHPLNGNMFHYYVPKKSQMHIAIRGANTRWMEICSHIVKSTSIKHIRIREANNRWISICSHILEKKKDIRPYNHWANVRFSWARLKMWHNLARFCQKSAARRLHRRTFLALSSITSFLITYYLPQQPLPLGISRRSDGTPAVTRFSFCGPVRVYCRRQLRSPAGPPFATRRRIFLIFELLFANRKFHRKSDTTKGYPKSQKISQASIFHLFWNHFGTLLVSLSMLFRKSRKS